MSKTLRVYPFREEYNLVEMIKTATIMDEKYETNGKFWAIFQNHKLLKSVFL